MIKLLIEYEDCYNFIRKHFSDNEYGSRNSLTIGFLSYLGFNVSKRWMKFQSYEDTITKFKTRRVVGKIMKTLVYNGYVSKFSNTTWKKESDLPIDVSNEEKIYFVSSQRVSI